MMSAKPASRIEIPHRLEARGWIAARWEPAETGKRRGVYRLTAHGRAQLQTEQAKWETFSGAMGLALRPLNRESV